MMGLRLFSLVLSAMGPALLLTGCASQQPPVGGEVDNEPPRIIYSDPLNETVNFEGNEINLGFNEFISLQNAQQQLIVSPPLKHPINITHTGKKVEISFTDTLYESTTYTFNFGNGIVDYTEANPLDSNVFVFSTGGYIDSLEYTGQVKDAFDLSPVKDVWVMLYNNQSDSAPKTELPRYFARTGEDGTFQVRYIAAGTYKVFALEDLNGSYVYDTPEERIAFMEGPIIVSPSDTSRLDSTINTFYLFKEKPDTQFVATSAIRERNRLELTFNMAAHGVELYNFAGDRLDTNWYRQDVPTGDTVVFWFTELYGHDTLTALIHVDDFSDTLEVRIRGERTGRGRKKDRETNTRQPLRLTFSARGGKLDFFKPLAINAAAPVSSIDTALLILVEGSDTLTSIGKASMDFSEVMIEYPWKQGTEYKLTLFPGAVISSFGDTNDTVTSVFSTTGQEEYGVLYVWHELPANGHGYIWQLLEKDGNVVDERLVNPEGDVHYPHLRPGNYQIKVIFDGNGNGKWDTGDYDAGIQPEKVIFYDRPLEVRANWENEIEWILTD